MTDEARKPAGSPDEPMNIPLAVLVTVGILGLLASAVAWAAAINAADPGLDGQPIAPAAAGWAVGLLSVGIAFLAGSLVVAAVRFSLEQILARNAAAPEPGSRRDGETENEPGPDAASTPVLDSNEEN